MRRTSEMDPRCGKRAKTDNDVGLISSLGECSSLLLFIKLKNAIDCSPPLSEYSRNLVLFSPSLPREREESIDKRTSPWSMEEREERRPEKSHQDTQREREHKEQLIEAETAQV